MVEIPEYKRDTSKDYLFILKSLNEIPFPIGKNLLIDFLLGEMKNKSIEKNKMFKRNNFGILSHLSKEEIKELIENLIINDLISISNSVFNKFAKVLSISQKGVNELINPKLNSKKISENYTKIETQISKEEIYAFKELENFLSGFNPEQKKAIISPKEKILCIAGAGTGKTSVLTKRIEFLNKMRRVKSEKILAITFTRKAKEEMKKRLELMGVGVFVETFNSFCEKILLKNGGRIYGRRVRVATFQDKMVAILRALDNFGENIQKAINKYFSESQKKNKNLYQLQNLFVSDCFEVFEYFKSTKKSFEEFKKSFSREKNPNLELILKITEFLEKHMFENGLRTYSDQINDVLTFFKMYPKFIPQFDHILVDEFQDVNSEQVELLDLLNSKNFFCVGDPRQSIFGWRGSKVKYILNFQKKYFGCEIITLKKNYRSNNHLVKLMNLSIKKMKLPDLETTIKGKKFLKLCKFSNENLEFNFIKEKILSSKISREEIFVLSRTNKKLLEFSKILSKEGIPHSIKEEGSQKFLRKKGEIVLSTIHSIKGLEAELVFLMGCTNNNFPCKSGDHPIIEKIKMYEYDKEEEELRLFYVAISRAKNKLYLTYSGKNHTYFINKEMKKELIEENFYCNDNPK